MPDSDATFKSLESKLPSDVPLGSAESRRILREMAIKLIALAETESPHAGEAREAPRRSPRKPRPPRAPLVIYTIAEPKGVPPLAGGPPAKAASLAPGSLATHQGASLAQVTRSPLVKYATAAVKGVRPLAGGPSAKAASLARGTLSTHEGASLATAPVTFGTITTVKGSLPTNPKTHAKPKSRTQRLPKSTHVRQKFEV